MSDKTYRILSIDAWAGESAGQWEWNNWFNVGEFPAHLIDLGPRFILKFMRDNGYLKPSSAGNIAIEDDQYNLVIVERSNRRPLYAIEYGADL